MLSRMLSICDGRNGLTDGLLDLVAETRGLLDTGAGLGADVQDEEPLSVMGKKFCPRNGIEQQNERSSSRGRRG